MFRFTATAARNPKSMLRIASPLLQRNICARAPRWVSIKRTTTALSKGKVLLSTTATRGSARVGTEMTAENVGRGVVGVASMAGIGALCFYGLGMAEEPGTVEYSHLWPAYIKQRVRNTFMYFGGGLALTAASAAGLYHTGIANRFIASSPMVFMGVTFVGTIGFMIASQTISYQNTIPKHLCWAGFNGCMGLSLVPICAMGGPLLARAAIYTGITVAGLTAIAACAPNEQFLQMGGALGLGLGVLVVSSLGTFFLPAGSAALPLIHNLSLYGGLVLFGGFVLYDTQKIIYHAEQGPLYPYDPINQSIGIYMDTINLFIRIATILAGSNSRRK